MTKNTIKNSEIRVYDAEVEQIAEKASVYLSWKIRPQNFSGFNLEKIGYGRSDFFFF